MTEPKTFVSPTTTNNAPPPSTVRVVKRNGTVADVRFDEILQRICLLSEGLKVDTVKVAQSVIQGMHDLILTSQLDNLACETAAALSSKHPDYSRLAGRVAVSNLHKQTSGSMEVNLPFLHEKVAAFVKEHMDAINAALDFEKDFNVDYFGFQTLERSYLKRDPVTDKVVERPQNMLMRVACGIHCGDLPKVLETYKMMSDGYFTHATPTMFNSGTHHQCDASCFLTPIEEDSIEGIFNTLKDCAEISKKAGGIGFSVSNVRASGSRIESSGGKSAGLLPFLRIFDATARAVDQGGGKRKGAFAAYLEPWHPDVFTFLDMKKNHGTEEMRARDLFYALWIPDEFMRRVEANEMWTLFCPSKCPDLVDLHSEAFEARYKEYELMDHLVVKKVPAQKLWFAILDATIETGNPFLLFKDAANRKSNQQNLGTIRSSNLCTEIIQYSDKDEIAVCNLASIALPKFVVETGETLIPQTNTGRDPVQREIDHDKLKEVVEVVTRNLNNVIDVNEYPLEKARRSNFRHRPIGLGVQGLADVFALCDVPFDSEEAQNINADIFETMYYAALSASCDLAQEYGPYETFPGSPASKGQLQFDLWDTSPPANSRWDWKGLKARIAKHGLRNSLLVAPMPTASTAQILGNNECIEPFTSNMYTRRVLAGEYVLVNKHLVRRLESIGMWTEEVRQTLIACNGSVQTLPIPDHTKRVFKTAWELSMRAIIKLAAGRGPYICQSQSLNLFVAEPDHSKLSSMFFYLWKMGLKGSYYLRTRPAASAVKTTVPVAVQAAAEEAVCRRNDPDCLACSA